MLRLTLAQMRRSLGRLTAAGLAIALGTAFVAATLLAGNAITRTSYDAVSSQYADADLVVTRSGSEWHDLTPAAIDAIAAVPGVEAVQPLGETLVELVGPRSHDWVEVTTRAPDPRLESATPLEGDLPATVGQIALPAGTAERLGVTVGDSVQAIRQTFSPDADVPTEARTTLTVSGLLDVPSAFLAEGGTAVVTADQREAWDTADGMDPSWYGALVALAPQVSADTVGQEITAAVEQASGIVNAIQVQTHGEVAAATIATRSRSTTVLTGVVLGFAAVALLVASMVISNTFQVLVAQRTRVLALLRCVGADRRQLRRSVLVEASFLGLVASAFGLLTGIALMQAMLIVLSRATDVPVPTTVEITTAVVVVPLLVGTAVTLLASLAPARAATRVSPLAALRPVEVAAGARATRGRLAVSAVPILLGAGGLTGGCLIAAMNPLAGLAVGVLGGAVSFFGMVIGAVAWVPRLLGRLGRLTGRSAASRLASANVVRNPRRVATTSAALFIGVTLVTMMSTGAASVTRTFSSDLGEQYPVDVVVESLPTEQDQQQPLPADLIAQVSTADGVAEHALVQSAQDLTFELPDHGTLLTTVYAGHAADLVSVMNRSWRIDDLRDGAVALSIYDADALEADVGDTVHAAGPNGSLDLTVTRTDGATTLMSRSTLAGLDTSVPLTDVWMRLASDADPTETTAAIADITAERHGMAMRVVSPAVERAFYQRVIDALLAVVVGLLGVAVVIAVVGVANTLSLSVLERRQESAILRAIGLTRGQLRSSLAIEGVLVAAVGALVGTALGVLYGWTGTYILLAGSNSATLAVPWRDLFAVLVVAVLAGLVASVLPARSAVRTSPVQALTAD